MSTLIDDLRDSGMHPICELAADEIEELEKAYALLFKENAALRQKVEAQGCTDMSTTPDPSMPVVAWLESWKEDRIRPPGKRLWLEPLEIIVKNYNQYDALVYQRDAEARIAELQARLKVAEDRVARLDEPWVDERGTAWLAPTAWAYAQVCRVRHELQARLEAAEKLLVEARDSVDDERLFFSEFDGRKRRETKQDHADRISAAIEENEMRRDLLAAIDAHLATSKGAAA